MKKYILFVVALILLTSGWAQKTKTPKPQPETKIKENVEITTPSGLKFKIISNGSGAQANSGDMVAVHYTGTFPDGKKFDSSRDGGQPYKFKLGGGHVIRGWDEGIALLHVGDRALLTVPPDLGYGAQDNGSIPGNSTLLFDVELMSAKPPAKPWDIKGGDTLKTASGLRYIVVEKSKDPNAIQAKAGKTVSVHYTLFLSDGRPVDSSVDRDEPFQFPLGQQRVIPGWDEGIGLMKTGDKLRLIVPSYLGYGEKGWGNLIPPNATLYFDVELMNVQ